MPTPRTYYCIACLCLHFIGTAAKGHPSKCTQSQRFTSFSLDIILGILLLTAISLIQISTRCKGAHCLWTSRSHSFNLQRSSLFLSLSLSLSYHLSILIKSCVLYVHVTFKYRYCIVHVTDVEIKLHGSSASGYALVNSDVNLNLSIPKTAVSELLYIMHSM